MSYTFDGHCFDEQLDGFRLSRQIDRVKAYMLDSQWRTLREISKATGAPEASASAHLRDLRKKRFGLHMVNKRRRGDPYSGLWEYQVVWRVNE